MKHLIPLAALLCGTAHAEFISGNTLLQRMQSDTTVDRVWTLGFVTGAHDAAEGVHHCSPATVTPAQVTEVVKLALVRTPEIRHHAASTLVAAALQATWPCQKAPKRPEVIL